MFKISNILRNKLIKVPQKIFLQNNKTTLKLINYNSRSISMSCLLNKKVSFNLSDIGEGIREVVVKEWFVNVGDKVSQFDNICEVQSDKASVTITSRYDGLIKKLYHQIDDIAFVGQPLVDLEVDDEILSTVSNNDQAIKIIGDRKGEKIKDIEEIKESPLSIATDNTTLCIPSVRRLAEEYKIDLSKIEGTGKLGQILKEDVQKYMENKGEKSTFNNDNQYKIEPIKDFTKAMFKTMTESLKIPHFVYSDEIDVTKLNQLRKELKTLPSELENNITLLPFFIKAASNSLKRYPIINSSVDKNEENITYWKSHNIGIAMATEQGLAVPVIKNVENLTILEIAKELNRLIKVGKDGAFYPTDLSRPTFSISNIGIIGGTYTKPVISPPQVAMFAIGIIQILPRFDNDGSLKKCDIINISGSADHRIIDGVTMANFIATLKKQLENPNLLFLNL